MQSKQGRTLGQRVQYIRSLEKNLAKAKIVIFSLVILNVILFGFMVFQHVAYSLDPYEPESESEAFKALTHQERADLEREMKFAQDLDNHILEQKRLNYEQVSRGNRVNRTLKMEATAYSHGCGNGDGITATGTIPAVGTIAVDPKVIPMGTKLYVEGYGYGVAADTGGAIKGNKIDLFMESRVEALQWGRREVEVKIYEH